LNIVHHDAAIARHSFAQGAARRGAILAVLRVVLFAFLRTSIADVRAHAADNACLAAAARHGARRKPAGRCAIDIDPDAAGHVGNLPFAEARAGTVTARCRARIPSGNAGLKRFTRHLIFHLMSRI
jgi:hypothetical protein